MSMKFKEFLEEKYREILPKNEDSGSLRKKKKKKEKDHDLNRLMFLSGIYGNLNSDGSFQSEPVSVSEERGEEMRYDFRFKRDKKKSEVIDAYNFNGGLSTEIRRAGPGDNPLYNNLNDKFKK